MFSRAIFGRRELGIRAALGASRGQLPQHLLVESLLLAASASAVGLAIGYRYLRTEVISDTLDIQFTFTASGLIR